MFDCSVSDARSHLVFDCHISDARFLCIVFPCKVYKAQLSCFLLRCLLSFFLSWCLALFFRFIYKFVTVVFWLFFTFLLTFCFV